MQCPTCKAGFSADMRFCPQDGTQLKDWNAPDNSNESNGQKAAVDEASAIGHQEKVEAAKSNGQRQVEDDEPRLDDEPEPSPPTENESSNIERDEIKPPDFSPGSITKTLDTSGKVNASTLGDPRLELIGQVVEDRYEIMEMVGRGGMSIVFKARDRRLKKIVAVKVLMPHLSVDPLSVQRFQQEATAASHLDHSGIVKVYNVGATTSGLPFMAMDYLEGRSLSSVIRDKGRLGYREALNIFVQLTAALSHAHEKGVIHRDLKPSNIILSSHAEETDVAKIVDFGIAKVLIQDGGTQAKLTQTGDVFGSPHYMSPEQCLGGELDERSDIYSMGCLMYEVLTGQPPHTGDSTLQILHKHISETPASFKSLVPDSNIPTELEAIVFKCLAPKRDDRIQTMRQLKADLAKLYLAQKKSGINSALAVLSLAWAKRPKLSAREKTLTTLGIVVSISVLAFAWFTVTFFDLTNSSPWINMNILQWVPPKQQMAGNEDKINLAFTQIDMYVKKHDDLIAANVVSPATIVRSLTRGGLELQQINRLEDAKNAFEAASEVAANHISRFSTSYVNLLFYKGRLFYEMEDYKSALKNLSEVINSDEWPAGHVWKGDCESMIGDCYNILGDKDKAEIYYKRALDRWTHNNCQSRRYAITAARYADLITGYNTQEGLRYAFSIYLRALESWSSLAEPEGQNIAICNVRMAEIMAKVGKKNQQMQHLNSADAEIKRVFGERSPKRAAIMMQIANALWNDKKHIASLRERYECWLILKDALPPEKTH